MSTDLDGFRGLLPNSEMGELEATMEAEAAWLVEITATPADVPALAAGGRTEGGGGADVGEAGPAAGAGDRGLEAARPMSVTPHTVTRLVATYGNAAPRPS